MADPNMTPTKRNRSEDSTGDEDALTIDLEESHSLENSHLASMNLTSTSKKIKPEKSILAEVSLAELGSPIKQHPKQSEDDTKQRKRLRIEPEPEVEEATAEVNTTDNTQMETQDTDNAFPNCEPHATWFAKVPKEQHKIAKTPGSKPTQTEGHKSLPTELQQHIIDLSKKAYPRCTNINKFITTLRSKDTDDHKLTDLYYINTAIDSLTEQTQDFLKDATKFLTQDGIALLTHHTKELEEFRKKKSAHLPDTRTEVLIHMNSELHQLMEKLLANPTKYVMAWETYDTMPTQVKEILENLVEGVLPIEALNLGGPNPAKNILNESQDATRAAMNKIELFNFVYVNLRKLTTFKYRMNPYDYQNKEANSHLTTEGANAVFEFFVNVVNTYFKRNFHEPDIKLYCFGTTNVNEQVKKKFDKALKAKRKGLSHARIAEIYTETRNMILAIHKSFIVNKDTDGRPLFKSTQYQATDILKTSVTNTSTATGITKIPEARDTLNSTIYTYTKIPTPESQNEALENTTLVTQEEDPDYTYEPSTQATQSEDNLRGIFNTQAYTTDEEHSIKTMLDELRGITEHQNFRDKAFHIKDTLRQDKINMLEPWDDLTGQILSQYGDSIDNAPPPPSDRDTDKQETPITQEAKPEESSESHRLYPTRHEQEHTVFMSYVDVRQTCIRDDNHNDKDAKWSLLVQALKDRVTELNSCLEEAERRPEVATKTTDRPSNFVDTYGEALRKLTDEIEATVSQQDIDFNNAKQEKTKRTILDQCKLEAIQLEKWLIEHRDKMTGDAGLKFLDKLHEDIDQIHPHEARAINDVHRYTVKEVNDRFSRMSKLVKSRCDRVHDVLSTGTSTAPTPTTHTKTAQANTPTPQKQYQTRQTEHHKLPKEDSNTLQFTVELQRHAANSLYKHNPAAIYNAMHEQLKTKQGDFQLKPIRSGGLLIGSCRKTDLVRQLKKKLDDNSGVWSFRPQSNPHNETFTVRRLQTKTWVTSPLPTEDIDIEALSSNIAMKNSLHVKNMKIVGKIGKYNRVMFSTFNRLVEGQQITTMISKDVSVQAYRLTCYRCQEVGHLATECKARRQSCPICGEDHTLKEHKATPKVTERLWCTHCKSDRHSSIDCKAHQQKTRNQEDIHKRIRSIRQESSHQKWTQHQARDWQETRQPMRQRPQQRLPHRPQPAYPVHIAQEARIRQQLQSTYKVIENLESHLGNINRLYSTVVRGY